MSRYDAPKICPQCGFEVLPPMKQNLMAHVVEVIRMRTDLTYKQIAEAYKLSPRTIESWAARAGIRRNRKRKV